MKVLFVTWEQDPFFKVGGLGDISRSLPGALLKKGIEVRVAMPYYEVLKMKKVKKTKVGDFYVYYDKCRVKTEVFSVVNPLSGVLSYLFKEKKYLNKVLKEETFAFFDKAVTEAVKNNILNFQPEIIHCNDNHCGLIPILVKNEKMSAKTLFTIHNLAFQGAVSLDVLKKTGLDSSKCRILQWEIERKKINFLMEGIVHADLVNTVSPTYAREIMTEEYGAGLNEILRGKEGRVFGILNGIDSDYNEEMHDKALKYHFAPKTYLQKINSKNKIYAWKEGKKLNKLFLQKKLGLKVSAEIPLFAFIGRIDAGQKGIDLIHRVLRRRENEEYQVVILGTGNPDWEERYKWLATFYPKSISCNFIFDETLARQIYAAADFILIPSKYEPCGLIQMIAMFYGTLPIARKTGGLADSIKDNATGFLFNKYSSEELEKTLKKAITIWTEDKEKYANMVEGAMAVNFSWNKSSEKYIDLYKKLINNNY